MWLSALSVARNCHTITTVCGFINIYLKTFYSTKNKPSSLRRIIKKHNKHFLYLPYPYLSISPSSVSRSPPSLLLLSGPAEIMVTAERGGVRYCPQVGHIVLSLFKCVIHTSRVWAGSAVPAPTLRPPVTDLPNRAFYLTPLRRLRPGAAPE